MREIRFRAWDKRQKVMSSPFTLERLFQGNKPSNWEDLEFIQYTGLKDKNGVEIYQGDYLEIQADEDGYGSTSYGGIVEVTSETCGFSLKPIKPTLQEREGSGQPWDSSSLWHVDDPENVAVIGNIYTNPELLTKETA